MNNKFDWTKAIYQLCRVAGKIGLDKRLTYRIALSQLIPNTDKAISILKRQKLFLITSTGRTGTTWLANFLNMQRKDLCVMHEPVPKEEYYHKIALMHPTKAETYLLDFRFGEIALRCIANKTSIYGEVNSNLRRHIIALKKYFPDMKIIHIVRDGRDYVRSVMSRKSYTKHDKSYQGLIPPISNIHPQKWSRFSRFERICWLWAYENSHMRKHADLTVRFEDIINSYTAFESKILAPLELRLNLEQEWNTLIRRPQNITREFQFPKWSRWGESDKTIFIELCGEEMSKYFYEITY